MVKYLTPEEVSARLNGRISVKTLANWRSQGQGPPFRRLGGRILYPDGLFQAWEAEGATTPRAGGDLAEDAAPFQAPGASPPAEPRRRPSATTRWLRARRLARAASPVTSVELLGALYEDGGP